MRFLLCPSDKGRNLQLTSQGLSDHLGACFSFLKKTSCMWCALRWSGAGDAFLLVWKFPEIEEDGVKFQPMEQDVSAKVRRLFLLSSGNS